MGRKHLVSPSILSADFNNLGDDIRMINTSDADMIHFDVMDGVFVPNISFGIPVIKHVNKIAEKPLDVHLMIINPDPYIKPFKEAGASIITVHQEVCKDLDSTIKSIKELGISASVCLSPDTPVNVLEAYIEKLDMVLLMSVHPGFGGQKFIENTYSKVAELRKMVDRLNPDCLIEVDGGVNYETGKNLYNEGANILVSGSFIFKAPNPADVISKLKNL